MLWRGHLSQNSVKERKGRNMEGTLLGQSSKQSSMESHSENHSAPHHIFFDIEKKEKFKKEKMFMFSLVFAFFASCSLDGSNLICRVTKEKWFAERRCVPEGTWHGVRRPENAMNVSHMGGCFSGSFFGSCPPLDYCSQRSKVEKREQSPHPTQAVQLVQLCLAPRYRQQGKMQCIGGGEETILPKLLYLGVWKVRRVWKWDYRINV